MQLTKPIRLQGTTRHYKGNGRALGYPTANIGVPTTLEDGVYFGFATLGEYTRQPALIFIGAPITMGDTERRVEAHLLDIPDVDYYGQELALNIRHFHRPNQTFTSVELLLEAIQADEAAARQWFAKTH